MRDLDESLLVLYLFLFFQLTISKPYLPSIIHRSMFLRGWFFFSMSYYCIYFFFVGLSFRFPLFPHDFSCLLVREFRSQVQDGKLLVIHRYILFFWTAGR